MNNERDLADAVRQMFDVYDRPCEQNGEWKHVEEYRALEDEVRRRVGAAPRKWNEPL